ncbi:GldG family protein, partial [bacterium]|nr:GldG family protein [bacterium]
RYSLAPQTVRVLDALDVDVRITAFYQRLDPSRKAAEVMLSSFSDRTDRISYEVVNPDVELSRVQEMGVTTARAVVVEGAGRRRELLDPDESTLINAVFRVMVGHQPIVYHLQGHGEHRLDDEERNGFAALDGVLRRQGYILYPLLLSDAPEVPADAQIVVIAAPQIEFAAQELAALHAFLARGGAVLALLDPGTPVSVSDWVSRYNVVPGDDFLVTSSRANASLRVDQRVMVVMDYPQHEITRGLPGMATFFPFAQSLRPRAEALVGVEAHTILRSDERSWAESDLSQVAGGKISFDEETDTRGPLPFGVALEVHRDEYFDELKLDALGLDSDDIFRQNEMLATLRRIREQGEVQLPPSVFSSENTSRLVVIGDSDFAVNANLNLYGNRDLLLNVLGWLAREQVLIAPRARETFSEPLVLSNEDRDLLGWSCAVAWPLLAGVIAVMVVVRRRRFH